jgi:glycosyltransferase involved in cell wall biosynthesis
MPARFVGLKRHIDVIKAAENIAPSQHIQIDFATFSHDSCPQKVEIESILKQSPAREKIKIVNPIEPPFDNYYRLLKNYDAIILPSENEGFGAVVPAALHCGKVAIVSNMVPASMYMRDSLNKYIIEVGDTTRLTELFNSLEKNELFNDGQTAHKFINKKFSSKYIASIFIGIIDTEP